MANVFDMDALRSSLLGSDSGDVSSDIQSVSSQLKSAIPEKDAAVLMLCARLGARDTKYQERVRQEGQFEEALKTAETILGASSSKFIGGDAPNAADAELLTSAYVLFGLCLKPDQRAAYPAVNAWFDACLEHASVDSISKHTLGKQRVGFQIDCFASSAHVRVNADLTNQINANTKKKKTQRQLEKEAKGKAKVDVPAAAASNGFTRVDDDAAKAEKISIVKEALGKVGADTAKLEVIEHTAAHTMAEMPEELKSKPGFVCKNLFLKAKKPRKDVEDDSCIWLVSVPEEAEVNMKALSKSLGYSAELRQAKPEVLLEVLGMKPGAVTPLALMNDTECKVNVVLDTAMVASPETISWFHPLTNEATMGVQAKDLLAFIAASGRKPIIQAFTHKGADDAGDAAGAPAASSAEVKPLELSHEDAHKRLLDRLAQEGIVPRREENPDLEAKRPIGHSTHNLFVKDKKAKKEYMIALRQSVDINLKALAKMLGAREVRMSSSTKDAFCHEKGCMTLLSLYNNVKGDVIPVIDDKLFEECPVLRVCTGCEDPLDHSQHMIADVPADLVKKLLAESNHPAPIYINVEEASN
mmetsp:Transcript_2662/g.6248  ORF Transcript_2662/g.6248 Transcript_2662/m.6248 type:complete len:585 (+) Transcript_2662:116-1870(+)